MTHTIVKKVEDYTQKEYQIHCDLNSILYVPCYLREWAIADQTKLIDQFVAHNGPNRVVKVCGTLNLGKDKWFSVTPKFLPLAKAMDKILTPDLNDVEIYYCDDYKRYYVQCYHGDDLINIFEFSLSDTK